MSTSLSASLPFVGQQIAIYLGIPLLLGGIIGGVLSVTVFLSLQTFRQNSCGFYLLIMQFFNLTVLVSGLLSRIVISGFNIDLTQTSTILCKLRFFMITTCPLMSVTCLCLATIDQYFATCSRTAWQRWSDLKIARRLVLIFGVIWLLYGISYLIFINAVKSPFPGLSHCSTENNVFWKFHNYVTLLILTGFLPIIIVCVFGCLAYRNVRELNYRTVSLVRQELDKQLTVMTLLQIFLIIFSLLPLSIVYILLISPFFNDPTIAVYIRLFNLVVNISFYAYFAGSFYIYICASERFRRQLMHVLFRVHLNRWQTRALPSNQVMPEI